MFDVSSMKQKWAFFGLAALTVLVSPVACGGIDEPNFFDSTGGSTSPHDGGTSSGFDSGKGGGSDSGTTITFDSGTTPPFDAGVIPPPDPGIFCGTDDLNNPIYCTGKQICCASGDMVGAPTYACGDESACSGAIGGSLVIPCDDTAECGTKICCGTFITAAPSYYSQIRCASSCTGADSRTFCDPANGNAECAAVSATSTCGESGALPGFNVCTN
jgi:hypothetical protein